MLIYTKPWELLPAALLSMLSRPSHISEIKDRERTKGNWGGHSAQWEGKSMLKLSEKARGNGSLVRNNHTAYFGSLLESTFLLDISMGR